MKYVGQTCCGHMNLVQNEGRHTWNIDLCRNLAKSIKRNTLAVLDSDISSE